MKLRGQTEGGEASAPNGDSQPAAQWFAIWTQSHCEQLVQDGLIASGFDAYLPTLRTWSRRAGKQRLIPLPMFPGYLFVRHAIDKHSYIQILKTRGIVRILGGRWDRLMPVSSVEIDALQRVQGTGLSVLPYPHLREGQRVRIQEGPLEGIEGILVRARPHRGLLVLSVDLLRQSVAVEVDCTSVVPIGAVPSISVPCHESAQHFL
jgi:transcription termination/antitermination protein NusG